MRYRIYYMTTAQKMLIPGAAFGEGVEVATLQRTHRPVAVIEAADLEDVFHKMQGEVWSPNGEARDLIKALGLDHTSMSVGDVVVDESGEAHVVAFMGFQHIGRV